MLWEFQIYIQYLSVCLLPALRWLERSMTCAKFVTKYSYTPNIDHFIILVTHDNLGRNVIESSTECCSFITKINKYNTFCLCRLTSQNLQVWQHCSRELYSRASSLDEWLHSHEDGLRHWLFVWCSMLFISRWKIFFLSEYRKEKILQSIKLRKYFYFLCKIYTVINNFHVLSRTEFLSLRLIFRWVLGLLFLGWSA